MLSFVEGKYIRIKICVKIVLWVRCSSFFHFALPQNGNILAQNISCKDFNFRPRANLLKTNNLYL
jgi:hypothetical protein